MRPRQYPSRSNACQGCAGCRFRTRCQLHAGTRSRPGTGNSAVIKADASGGAWPWVVIGHLGPSEAFARIRESSSSTDLAVPLRVFARIRQHVSAGGAGIARGQVRPVPDFESAARWAHLQKRGCPRRTPTIRAAPNSGLACLPPPGSPHPHCEDRSSFPHADQHWNRHRCRLCFRK